MLADERLKLGDDVGGVTELDVGLDPLLERDEPELAQPPGLRLRPLLERELGQRGAAPELERAPEKRPSLGPRGTPRVGEELLEAVRVDLLSSDLQDVAGSARDESLRPEELSERDDRVLQRRRRGLRRLLAVELVDELLRRDDAPGAQEQRDEERALPRPPEGDLALLVPHLERAEDPELLHVRRL